MSAEFDVAALLILNDYHFTPAGHAVVAEHLECGSQRGGDADRTHTGGVTCGSAATMRHSDIMGPTFFSNLLAITIASGLAAQDPAALVARAERAAARDDFARARLLLDQAIERDADYASAWVLRARVRNRSGDHVGAFADAAKALELRPRDARAFIERGYAMYKQGQHEAAVTDYDQAIAIDPGLAIAHGDRGDAHKALGRLEAAIADYTRAIALYPKFVEAYLNRGQARWRMGDLAGAEADYDVSIDLAPGNPGFRTDRADIRWLLGRGKEAAADLLGAAAKQGELSAAAALVIRHHAACIQFSIGLRSEARAAFAAIAKDADSELRIWAHLMLFCANSLDVGVDSAKRALSEALATDKDPIADLPRQLVDLCLGGDATASPTQVGSVDKIHLACAWSFFASCIAAAASDREEARRLLVRCINTGDRECTQWMVALAMLRGGVARGEIEALNEGLGLRLADEKEGRRRIAGFAKESAGRDQDLRLGDELVTVGERSVDDLTFDAVLRDLRVGGEVAVTLLRDGERVTRRVIAGYAIE